MKTRIVLKEFSALPSGAVQVTHASAPANPESSPKRMSDSVQRFAVRQVKRAEKFREMLRRRDTTPFASAIPYHRFGINE
jgi:hypothetical protein